VSPFRSVGGKLALGLVAVVAGVLAIVYVIVVPLYRTSLQNAELRALAGQLAAGIVTYPQDPASPYVDQWALAMAEQYGVRAIVFDAATVTPFADSNLTTDDSDLVNDAVARKAAGSLAPARGVVMHNGKHVAEVAYPFPSVGRVAMFTRRIRRLEAAADRIAGGDFGEPVVDPGSDEVGELARTFERMRLRLADLDRARGEFIANASHELRTPLFSLGGFLELLDDPDLDEPTRREFLAQMREQVDRLTKLATDLLDLSRLDAGRLAVAREPLDLTEPAGELVAEFGPRARGTDHVLELVQGGPAPALGDPERVLQIGRVLVENALVHTPPGTTVRVGAGLDGGRATLTVSDDGPGIPADARNQVFQRFYRLEGTRASGSGLGLAIARELAERMGGRIELEPADGWTRFTLVLSADRVAFARENDLTATLPR